MNLKETATYIRLILTAAVTTLAALYPSFPHATWIPAVIIVVSALGIHVVPSIQQSGKEQ